MKKNLFHTFCQNCHMKCRIFVTVKNGRIEYIANGMDLEGVKTTPAMELIYHADRVVSPLLRKGERGEGKWESITWDRALDLMAEKFGEIRERYGPEAVATIRGCGHKDIPCMATSLFAHVIGTPNVLDINHSCTQPTNIGEKLTIGDRIIGDIGPDYQRSKCIMIWGAVPKNTRPPVERDINIARSKGAKLIWIDPRPPERLDKFNLGLPDADMWLRIRPGTDAALALAMIHVVISEKLYNAKLVKDWCIGFEDLTRHVQDCTPQWAEQITWVGREQIIEAARVFAKTKPSCLHSRLGAGAQHVNATQTARSLSIFMVLAADLDVPGGNLLTDKLRGFKTPDDIAKILRPPPEVELRRIGAREYPIISGTKETAHFVAPQCHTPTAIRAMIEKRIKALYVPGCNLAVMEGDSRQTCKALRSLDFLAVADFFLTPTAELADLVLPAAHWLETETPLRAYQVMGPKRYNHILASKKVLDPIGHCWDDRKIVIELAKRMRVKIPWENVGEYNDWILESVGVRFKDIQKKPYMMLSFPLRYKTYEASGFNTPSGKIELRSSMLENLGYEPLPKFYEPPESPVSKPDLAREYPMILITHRKAIYMHSEFRQLPSYRKLEPDPVIELSTEAAAKLRIKDSDDIWIERPGFEDRVRGKAKLVDRLHPNVVSMVVGWWFPERQGPEHGMFESNINTVISNGPPYDPINGNHQARAIPCRIGRN